MPLKFLKSLPEQAVILALGNDPTSELMAQKIIDLLPNQPVRSQSKLLTGVPVAFRPKTTLRLKPGQSNSFVFLRV